MSRHRGHCGKWKSPTTSRVEARRRADFIVNLTRAQLQTVELQHGLRTAARGVVGVEGKLVLNCSSLWFSGTLKHMKSGTLGRLFDRLHKEVKKHSIIEAMWEWPYLAFRLYPPKRQLPAPEWLIPITRRVRGKGT